MTGALPIPPEKLLEETRWLRATPAAAVTMGAANVTLLGALLMSTQAKVGTAIACVLFLVVGTAILWKPGGGGPIAIGRGAETRPADSTVRSEEPRPDAPHVAEAPAIVPKSFVEAPDRSAAPTPGVIRGEVLDVDRTPAADVPVVVFDMRDGAPHSQASQRTQTDEQGRFSLSVPTPLAWTIALVAFKPMRRPATQIVDGEQVEPVTLVLGEGAAIEGIVRVDGQPPRGSSFMMRMVGSSFQVSRDRGRVHADIRFGVPGCFSGNDELWWTGTAFETKLGSVGCDAEGTFRIAGLARDTYRVDASNLVDESGLNLDIRADVTAPATGVELGLATGRLRIRLEGNGRVLQGGRISVVNPEGGSIRTESADPLEFRVGAGVPLTVEAARAGFAQKSVPVPPLSAGELRDLTIELDPAKTASLRLTLRGAEAMNLDRVSARFVPLAEPEGRATSALEDLRETLVAVRTLADEFVLEHLPLNAGSYILVVIPHSHDSWILPFEKDVTVPAEGVVAVTHDAIAGGRVDVAGLDPDGHAVSGRWSLRDGNGIEALSGQVFGVMGSWTVFARGLGMGGTSSARVRANELRRNPGVVAAGSYEIILDADGFKTARSTVNVVAGTVTRFEVRVEPDAPR